METKFNHSIKVPSQLRTAAKFVRKAFEEGASVKGQIFEEKHARTQRLYALIAKISKHKNEIDHIIEKSRILIENPRLDMYMGMVLITELLFGTGKLPGESKPVECVRNYKEKFDTILNELNTVSSAAAGADNTQKGNVPSKPRYVRVNTNLMSRSEAIEAFEKDGWNDVGNGIELESYDKFLELISNLGDMDYISDMHVQNLFVFPASSKKFWALNSLVKESKVILQDKSSCLPTILLAPPKKSIVLDMCAAPGGKTTHLAAIMKNKGCIYAVEQNTQRFKILSQRVNYTKSSIVKLFNQDALSLTNEQVPNVEYICVDPSCSGSGMIDQLFRFDEHTKADRLYSLAGLQIKILSYAMCAFPNAKKIVYSTCSIHPEENEQVIQRSLDMYPHWELIKPLEFAEKWKNFGSPKYKHIGKKCIYAKSDVDLTNGFFVAVLQRRENVEFDHEANRILHWNKERAVDYEENYENDDNYDNYETIEKNGNKRLADEMNDNEFEEKSATKKIKVKNNKCEEATEIISLSDDVTNEKPKTENKKKLNKEISTEELEKEKVKKLNDEEKSSKKKSKRTECEEATQTISLIDDDETNEKSKKKKKKKVQEEDKTLNDEINDNEFKREPSKKKSKRTECEEAKETISLIDDDETSEKSKRKKKKKDQEEEKSLNDEMNHNKFETESSKKKSKRNDCEEVTEIISLIDDDETNEKSKRKKKKKAQGDERVTLENEKIGKIEDLEVKKKKKKNKKDIHKDIELS